MKILTGTFLTAVVLGSLLTGCNLSDANADKGEINVITQKSDSQAQQKADSKTSVSEEHKQLLLEALELAKKGEVVKDQKRYQNITEDEVHQVLGEAANTEMGDGSVGEDYKAGKYLLRIFYPCGKCMDDGKTLKIGELDVIEDYLAE